MLILAAKNDPFSRVITCIVDCVQNHQIAVHGRLPLKHRILQDYRWLTMVAETTLENFEVNFILWFVFG